MSCIKYNEHSNYTQFYKNAKALDRHYRRCGGYWAEEHELFAPFGRKQDYYQYNLFDASQWK